MKIQTGTSSSIPRKANECFTGRLITLPQKLFGEYWLDGEIALLFGPSGVGKSVLAVQVGDALARGRPVDGFSGSTRRRKVLYVDLNHTDTQFQTRYSRFTEFGRFLRSFRFAERFYRGRPAADEDLFEWLRKMIAEHRFESVLIDDVTAIRKTQDGTRELISLIRRLRELQEEFGISVLVLTASDAPTRDRFISEVQLKRSRVLCGLVDSVFALSPDTQSADRKCLIHIRTSTGPAAFPDGGYPFGSTNQTADGMIEFRFDNYRPWRIDSETRRLISEVHKQRQTGTSYRQIAIELGISKSRAERLGAKWRPGM